MKGGMLMENTQTTEVVIVDLNALEEQSNSSIGGASTY